MTPPLTVSVFASGEGGNLQAIMDARIAGTRIAPVVCDRHGARAAERARSAGLPVEVVDRAAFASREGFEAEIAARIAPHAPGLIALAGFMRVLSPAFVKRFAGKIMNIHPSLLPSFPGRAAVKQALDYGVRFTGCTVHFVDEGVDTGPVILQAAVPVEPEDTEETLSRKIHAEEHRIYPEAVRLFASGAIRVSGRKVSVSRPGRGAS